MTSSAGRYDELPPSVSLDDTIAEHDPDDAPDPNAGRNVAMDEAIGAGG
jgi:hypothetical protein